MGFFDWLFGILEWLGLRNKTGKLILLGLDNAGKTTLLNLLKTGQFQQFEPSKTYQRQELTVEGINFQAYDLGGHDVARESWNQYFDGASAVVYMVDSADPNRIQTAASVLSDLLTTEALRNVPFLILGNKIDVSGAMSDVDLARCLNIGPQTDLNAKTVPPGVRPIRLFMCSLRARTGYGEGFRWLSKFI